MICERVMPGAMNPVSGNPLGAVKEDGPCRERCVEHPAARSGAENGQGRGMAVRQTVEA